MTDPTSRAGVPAPEPRDLASRAPQPRAPELRAPGSTPPSKTPPQRPTLANPNTAPVLTKLTPPFSVRVAELFWILGFICGGFAIVYLFVIRKEQLPLISDAVRAVDATRSDQTYTTAADIIFWSVFGLLVATLLVQITLLVSFMARRPHIRLWQLLTWVVQVATLALSLDLALTGERAAPLQQILAAQCGLVLLALLASVIPGALAWSARKHDVVRQPSDGVATSR